MALLDLIRVGIESRARGMINYLVRQGRALMAPSTATEAAGNLIHTMSMRDPEDRTLTHQITREQQQVIQISSQLTRESIVGNLSQLPGVITFPPQATGDVRYLVVVKMRDSATGAIRENIQEIYSDVPILPTDVKAIAIQQSMSRMGQDTITGALGVDANWFDAKATIISASKRQ